MENVSSHYSFYVDEHGLTHPIEFSSDEHMGPGIPRYIIKTNTFQHEGTVSAVALSHPTRYVFIGGQESVEIWDLGKPALNMPVAKLHCLDVNPEILTTVAQLVLPVIMAWNPILSRCYSKPFDKHVRSIKLLPDGRTAVIGGETSPITVWDIAPPTPRTTALMPFRARGCFALALNPDSNVCYSSHTNGLAYGWDYHNQLLISQFKGHEGGVTCLDVSGDGNQLWTGGLDHAVRSWDLRTGKQTELHYFPGRVTSLACSQSSGCRLVGLDNDHVAIMHDAFPGIYFVTLHQKPVMSVKFSPISNWFLSTGQDAAINLNKTPNGAFICQAKEATSVWCSDISKEGTVIAFGSFREATLYKLIY